MSAWPRMASSLTPPRSTPLTPTPWGPVFPPRRVLRGPPTSNLGIPSHGEIFPQGTFGNGWGRFGCVTGVRCCWHLMGRARGCCSTPCSTQDSPTALRPSPTASGASPAPLGQPGVAPAPGSIPSFVYLFTKYHVSFMTYQALYYHLISSLSQLSSSCCYCPCFIGEETEARRGEVLASR